MDLLMLRGTASEVTQFVQQNPALFPPSDGTQAAISAGTLEASPSNGMTPDELRSRLLGQVAMVTDKARAAVEFICRHAPRVKFDAVAYAIGVPNNQTLGGVMSSLGHSATSLQEAITRDWSRGEYVIDPGFAKVVLEVIEQYSAHD